MTSNVAQEVTLLSRLSIGELRDRFAKLFGEPTRAANRTWLIKRIAWRLQVLAEGDLSQRARRRIAELANDADLRLLPPRPTRATQSKPGPLPQGTQPQLDARLPLPGSLLIRRYKGATLRVQVLAQGFEYEGALYASLSAVAKAITGSHCNGYLFFRLNPQPGELP
jgi:Protein of unknown function (DUF2924)